jgi:hypothetical protein
VACRFHSNRLIKNTKLKWLLPASSQRAGGTAANGKDNCDQAGDDQADKARYGSDRGNETYH